MTDATTPSSPMTVLDALGDEGLNRLEQFGRRQHFEPGAAVFVQGEPVDECHLILSGAIEMFLVLDDGTERLVGTLREGGLAGAIALAGHAPSAGRARASEPTDVVTIPRGALRTLLDGDMELTMRLVPALFLQMGRQANLAIEELVRTARWSADISGLTRLPFGDLLTTPREITAHLVGGRAVRGKVLKYDASAAGGFLVLGTENGGLELVRLEAVASLECPRADSPAEGS